VALYAGEYFPTTLGTVRDGFGTIAKKYSNSKARNVVVPSASASASRSRAGADGDGIRKEPSEISPGEFPTNTPRFFMISNQMMLLLPSGAMQTAEEAVPPAMTMPPCPAPSHSMVTSSVVATDLMPPLSSVTPGLCVQ